MTAKPELNSLTMAKKRPVGIARLLIHIVVLSLLGALALYAGLHGRDLLKAHADGSVFSKRVDVLHRIGMDEAASLMQESTPDDAARAAISRASSMSKRGLKQTVSAMLAEGKSDSDIADTISDTMLKALKTLITDSAQYQAIQTHIENSQKAFHSSVSQKVLEELKDFSLEAIRSQLSPTVSGYALMYYHQALLVLGGVLLLLAAFLLYVYLFWQEERKLRLARMLEPIDYLLPFFVGVMVFTLYPVVRVVLMSFQERFKLDGSFDGWGLQNYRHVLLGVPGTTNYFMQGLQNTMLFVLYTVPLSTVLSIVIAYLLNQKLRFSALFQTSYFLPMVTSITAVGLVWRWLFHKDYGLINAILSLFGVDRIQWLQQAGNSMAVLVIFAVWSSLPFTIILLLSGLQNIDESYYTVARVDGAKGFRIFRRITLPLLAPTIGLVLTINSISAFKVFTEVTVLFNGRPGPVKNMYTVVYYIFEVMRGDSLEYGRAAAAAIVLFLLIFIFTMLQRYIQRKWSYT